MGIGKTRKKCEEYIIKHNLNNNIKIIEGNIKELITKLDVFVLATHYEGLPLVLCEAMAAKTPIIATDVPGVNEIILDEKTGLLVKENDKIDLANSIIKLKNNKLKREEIENKSYEWVLKNFNREKMNINYKNVINKLK